MDFGYDELGRRTGAGAPNGLNRSDSEGSSSSSDDDMKRNEFASRGKYDSDSSNESSGSSGNDENERGSSDPDEGHHGSDSGSESGASFGSDGLAGNRNETEGRRKRRHHKHSDSENDDDDDDSVRSVKSRDEDDSENSSSSDDSGSELGDDVELVIGEEGEQDIEQPLVDGAHAGAFSRMHKKGDESDGFRIEDRHTDATGLLLLTDGSDPSKRGAAQSFLDLVSGVRQRLRNVAFVGGLHHGKTSLLSLILGSTAYRQRRDEIDRCISLKTNVASALLDGAHNQKTTMLVNCIDTPGHTDFFAEAAAGIRLADSVALCVDSVESLTAHGERLLRHVLLKENLPVILILTKVDRLILDLKLPPLDAYRKLRIVIDTVNNVIASCGKDCFVSPLKGTVCFTSSRLGFFFTLESFAHKYSDVYPTVDPVVLSKMLWGQVTFEKGKFVKITGIRQRPSFVTFILEPLYKVVAHSITGKGHENLSAGLKPLPRSPQTAAEEAIRFFCGAPEKEAADALLSVLPTPMERSSALLARYMMGGRGKRGGALNKFLDFSKKAVEKCEDGEEGKDAPADAPNDTVVAVSPLQRVHRNTDTFAVIRVVEGVLKKGSVVVMKDEHTSDVEPFFSGTVGDIFIKSKDGFISTPRASAGQVVFVSGLGTRPGSNLLVVGGAAARALLGENDNDDDGNNEVKDVADEHSDDGDHTAANNKRGSTIPEEDIEAAYNLLDDMVVAPLKCGAPLVHVAVELKEPAKAAAFQTGLQALVRTTPGLDIQKEETGEFTVIGYGELHLDTALHELHSSLCKGAKYGVSQPFVRFSETVIDKQGQLATAGIGKLQLGCVSGTLDRGLTARIENDELDFFSTDKDEIAQVWSTMRKDYGYDILASRSVMALGPGKTKGTSILFDDLLEEENLNPLTPMQRQAIIRGFCASIAAGPLTGEIVRGVSVKLIFADVEEGVSPQDIQASARSAVKQALIGAQPRLLEPVFAVEIVTPPERIAAVTEILHMRRGAIRTEDLIPATTLVSLKAFVPIIDSFGLETQLRMSTSGEAFPQFSFDSWDVVPGNPFDTTIRLGHLEPARGFQLARDFVLKTRYRKGLPADFLGEW